MPGYFWSMGQSPSRIRQNARPILRLTVDQHFCTGIASSAGPNSSGSRSIDQRGARSGKIMLVRFHLGQNGRVRSSPTGLR